MAMYTIMQIPEIAVTPAPYEKPVEEPASPFAWATVKAEVDDGFRRQHLTPPLVGGGRQLSPLRPNNAPVTGKGLERERFEALLKASRERNAAVGSKKPTDLRKEVALKQHKGKQLERRMLFLSKLRAPPSPTATLLPKTPPESPAVFHYTLPSPGLESPLAAFEHLISENPARISSEPRESWVEQVLFRFPADAKPAKKPPVVPASVPSAPSRKGHSKRLPSLDQITARMSFPGLVHAPPVVQAQRPVSSRLPAFLRLPESKSKEAAPKFAPSLSAAPKRPALASVGRLRIPNRTVSSPARTASPISAPIPVKAEACTFIPLTPVSPKLEVTVTLVPRTTTSPSNLSESNLMAFDSNTSQRRDMLSVIKRRTSSHSVAGVPCDDGIGHGFIGANIKELVERRLKRNSAPPELQSLQRCGFQHPVLALPGGF